MSVAHRWGRITKCTSLACLALAILSTLVLNIVSSYSLSKIESNAINSNSEVSTQANDSPLCDPDNTNAESCISMSISSHPATGDTNDGNLSLSIPRGGGLVAGRHTVSVKSNSINGYQLRVEAASGIEEVTHSLRGVNLELVHNDGSVDKERVIPSLTQDNGKSINYGNTMPIENNTWGIAIPGSSLYSSSYDDVSVYESYITNPRRITTAETAPKFAGMYTYDPYSPSTRGVIVDNSYTLDEISTATPVDGNSLAVYYGVRVDNPNELLAGNYQAEVVYTATVNLPPTPTNLSVSPTTYEFDSCNDSLITIKGNNLSSAYEVYLQKSGTSDETNRLACTNLNLDSTNNQLTCNIPTSRDEVELNTTYDIYVISQAVNQGVLKNAFTYTEPATGLSVKSDNENIIVDYDTNMIPVKYVGYDGNGGGHWESLTKSEIESNTDTWFNYTNKQWANAVTVTKDSLSDYKDKHAVIDNNDVLGYWVYIPRYAYEVQRRDAIDAPVDPQNFDIVFQAADEKNTPAPTKSTESNHLDYRNSGINRTYVANSNNTTWATHPAFTWGGTELNGLWVGKYETTGKISAPTVKPNQHANISEYIGNFYLAAKSIGKEDKCNVGGGSSSTSTTGHPTLEEDLVPNSHNLATTKSHMLKNSEWGIITYLAHSKYGAGINASYTRKSNVSKNGARSPGSADADGNEDTSSGGDSAATGCGPSSRGNTGSYTVDVKLDENTIESDLACGSADKAYNGSTGIYASTTNTVYGVYDTAGGVGEHVMGNKTTSETQTTTISPTFFRTPTTEPYVDLYKSSSGFGKPASWSLDTSNDSYYNYDVCTFETCGGTATYETTTVQSVSSTFQSWGRSYSGFVGSADLWFHRGGYSSYNIASPFYTGRYSGANNTRYGSRAALLALPGEQ